MSDDLKRAIEPFRWYLSSSWFDGLPDETAPQHSENVARRPPTLGDYRRLVRAASLLSQSVPDAPADGDVERVAKAMYVARVGASQNCYEFEQLNSEGQHHVYDGLILEARAALAAMSRPAVDRERLAEIRERHEQTAGLPAAVVAREADADRAWLLSELLKMIGPLTKGESHED